MIHYKRQLSSAPCLSLSHFFYLLLRFLQLQLQLANIVCFYLQADHLFPWAQLLSRILAFLCLFSPQEILEVSLFCLLRYLVDLTKDSQYCAVCGVSPCTDIDQMLLFHDRNKCCVLHSTPFS